MKKLIILFMVMLFSLPMYSYSGVKKLEYLSVGKQFNTVVVNVPASFIIKQAPGHSVKVINESAESFIYEIKNDTLIIKSKKIFDIHSMDAKNLKVTLTHPNPDVLLNNFNINGRGLDKIKSKKTKSGNQK
jgi:hypothetical protein